MSLIKYNYKQIKSTAQIKGICQKCGKRRSKTITVSQTVNPYNRNTNGSIKEEEEISQSIVEDLERETKKQLNNFICATCKNNLPWPYAWPAKKGIE